MNKILYITLCLSQIICICVSQGIKLPDEVPEIEERRNGRNLFDLIGFGSQELDPYQIKLKQLCLNGEFAECFKLQAVNSLGDFFTQNKYLISPAIKIVTLPETQLRSLQNDPIEYVAETRDSDSEWDQLQKFVLRKAERFIKATAFEVQVPDVLQQDERLSPRFIDDAFEETDLFEDRKTSLHNKHRLKKMIIPMLLILKLFKLKLLLFLPFVLGLAGIKKLLGFAAFVLPDKHRLKKMIIPMLLILKLFKLKLLLFLPFVLGLAGIKKLLGFAAFVLPGALAYFKVCKPNFGLFKNPIQQYTPQYNSNGFGFGGASSNFQNYYKESHPTSDFSNLYHDNSHYRDANGYNQDSIKFNDDSSIHDLPYQGYSEYRNKNVNFTSES
uniref:CSON001867 protein n=1 Tax=Culicoides sonorensis TaxID=179676 RepID=A0A336MK83_CULSO